MLKDRVMTATVLILLVVSCIFFLPNPAFTILSSLLFLYALWEWTKLAGFNTQRSRAGFLIAVPIVVFGLLWFIEWLERGILFEWIPLLVLLFWFSVPLFLFYFPTGLSFWKSPLLGMVAGLFVLVPSWVALNVLHDSHPGWVLYILVLIWVADIAAYFTGRRFGKHKLASFISPGKSWEGVAGALITTQLLSFFGYFIFKSTLSMSLPIWMLLGLVTISFSIVGDLFESAFKRARGVKDSGSILPGHGGLLDRIDSLTSALPIFTIGLLWLQ